MEVRNMGQAVAGGGQIDLPGVQPWTPRRRVPLWTIVRHVVLAFFALIILFPIAWVVIMSVKSLPDAY